VRVNEFYLGVDGGQSSTTALIGDAAGRVVGRGVGGPCNHVGAAEGQEKFVRTIGECVSAAAREADRDFERIQFASACLGFSGGPADKEEILRRMLRAERMVVTTDALIALSGATGGAPGIITIAGTGSIAFGRNAQGQTARAGGWGYVFGDGGSGFDLARRALQAALRFEEGWGAPTALHAMLLEATGARDANDLLHRFYTTEYPRPRIANLSKLVDEAAQSGDAAALEIVELAAGELARLAGAVRAQLFAPGEEARVAYIGGVFRSAMLRECYIALVDAEPGNRCGPPAYGPAAGALIEAYRAAGLTPALENVPEFEK
jgi:N-acetylglucosamine kinase-like BadF-type ATPase